MSVVIAGAGPAGLALSYLLARNGVSVTLLEREHDFDRVFRGEGLMPSGVDALLQMGLGGLLLSLPFRKLESWDLFIEGRDIMSVPEPFEELGDRAMRIIPQTPFLEGMVAKAAEFANFRILRGADVRDLTWENDRVTGLVANTEQGETTIKADLVVGCDGRGSLVRTRAGVKLKLLPVQYDILWFKMPAPADLLDHCRMMMYASNARMALSYTSWDGRLQFAVMQRKGERLKLTAREWAEDIGRATPAWMTNHLRSVADSIEGPTHLNVLVGRGETWAIPGLLLIGDAAHPMSPIRAQGINLALRDAIVAANNLVPVLKVGNDPEAIDAAARAVQAEREPEIVRSQTLQDRDTRGIGTWYAPVLIGLAKFLGPIMGKYPWAQRAWLEQQRDLRFGSREVRLTA